MRLQTENNFCILPWIHRCTNISIILIESRFVESCIKLQVYVLEGKKLNIKTIDGRAKGCPKEELNSNPVRVKKASMLTLMCQ